MVATTWQRLSMEALIDRLRRDHPNLVFTVGDAHCWSPQYNKIFYASGQNQSDIAGLLHEVGHARLGHKDFTSDFELLQKEAAAWQEALRLAERYEVIIDDALVQDCLDTYRDWLFRRSRCPNCQNAGIQQTPHDYSCLNCSATWQVTTARLRRPYRLQTHKK